ncbi:hypothetical protein TSUD_237230 [Trifolium subterraneum]|uniref:Plastid lipid-associated protein/fibrillin conserved domain-containing protein n=1 Tax=Trifolium subterraneum TaxID=3900 RepID=A0A2Z6NHS9_TRISU|nr:hypothetical protein TSUD_237230 [Trifolium subterraneum]
MALLSSTLRVPLIFSQNPKPSSLSSLQSRISLTPRTPRFPSLRFTAAGDIGDADIPSSKITDEWGEKSEPVPEAKPSLSSKVSNSVPSKNEDEWGKEAGAGAGADSGSYSDAGNGTFAPETPVEEGVGDENEGLKRALVDTVYGTELGFRAGSEVRAEVSELVAQLEASNPTPAPVEELELLSGNWVLLYTASSELLPLLAAGSLPLLKVDKILQTIDTDSFTIINSVTLSSPVASLSFSASASFEVRSPTRVQVTFKEGSFQPPEIKSKIDLPENISIFGQNISLAPLQQSLGPLEGVVGNISRVISGQSPLKIPIPGERRASSWLLTTYLDKDLRISRGDGGLFVLAREGSPLLDQ